MNEDDNPWWLMLVVWIGLLALAFGFVAILVWLSHPRAPESLTQDYGGIRWTQEK